MIQKLFYTGSIVFLALLASCQRVVSGEHTGATQQKDSIKVAGNWYNDDNLLGCMTLCISDSNGFDFYEANGTINRHSKGKWLREGNRLSLTSNSMFKQQQAAQPGLKAVTDGNGRVYYEWDAATRERIAAMPRHWPAPGDTLGVYFDRELYLLEKDTLYKLDRYGEKTEMKFHR